jgi:drug/metabolite transporter (DMT)-like permease
LSKVQAPIAELFACLMPVFTIILAMLFLNENTEVKEWIGIAIIIKNSTFIMEPGFVPLTPIFLFCGEEDFYPLSFYSHKGLNILI